MKIKVLFGSTFFMGIPFEVKVKSKPRPVRNLEVCPMKSNGFHRRRGLLSQNPSLLRKFQGYTSCPKG